MFHFDTRSAYDSEDKIFVDDASDFVAGDQFDVVCPNLVYVIALALDAAVSISITTDPYEAGQLSTLTHRLEVKIEVIMLGTIDWHLKDRGWAFN